MGWSGLRRPVPRMYAPLQPCVVLWKVRTRRAQSVFWRCEHADEGGSNPRMRHLGSVCRARSPHSCELCLGHPVRSPQSALAVRIPANPASDTPFAVRSPHSQSAFRPSLFGGPVRSPQSALAVRTRTEIRDGTCPLLGGLALGRDMCVHYIQLYGLTMTQKSER